MGCSTADRYQTMHNDQVPEFILGIAAVAVGLSVALLASINPCNVFSNWYESHKDAKLGLWAVSRNERQFRIWNTLVGAFLFIGGIVVLLAV